MAFQHILLISGPSGAGKSAFIRHLEALSLPDEIKSLLPTGCHQWPSIEANDVLKGNRQLDEIIATSNNSPNIVFHYDIVMIHTRHLESYENDPVMALLSRCQKLTIVSILPKPAVLIAQFSRRLGAQRSKKSIPSKLWAYGFKKPMRYVLNLVRGKKHTPTHLLYQQNQWIEHCYQQWNRYTQSLLSQEPSSTMISLEPSPSSADNNFILCASSRSLSTTAKP